VSVRCIVPGHLLDQGGDDDRLHWSRAERYVGADRDDHVDLAVATVADRDNAAPAIPSALTL
jgi:hypothetical protein